MKVFITGATGFFGRALARTLLAGGAERVVLFSRSESRQAAVAERLHEYPNARFRRGDMRDRDRLEEAMWGCDAVVHCAALKRVDAVADNPGEVRKTNVVGSANVIAAARAIGASKVLMISSDKAASPSTSYGASKAQMEHEAIASNTITISRGLRVSCTRWGNVLRSTGSVTEIWLDQLRRGAPITVTEPTMTRFVISRQQAVDFCLTALQAMEGGELFIPRLPATTVRDLLRATAILHGADIDPEGVQIVGARPGGEKHDELLITGDEASRAWARGDTVTVLPSPHAWRETFSPPSGAIPCRGAYSSDQPSRWVGVDDLVSLLKETDPDE